jgi:hypothetical protein
VGDGTVHSAWQLGYELNDLEKVLPIVSGKHVSPSCQQCPDRPCASPILLHNLVPQAHLSRMNWSERQADYSHPPRAEIKKGGAILPLPVCLRGILLCKTQEQLSSVIYVCRIVTLNNASLNQSTCKTRSTKVTGTHSRITCRL